MINKTSVRTSDLVRDVNNKLAELYDKVTYQGTKHFDHSKVYDGIPGSIVMFGFMNKGTPNVHPYFSNNPAALEQFWRKLQFVC